MRRYWIEKKDLNQEHVSFSDEIFHHIFDVCRQDLGSRFEVITEDSVAYLVEVIERGKKKATAKIIEERKIQALKKPYIHLCLSIPKFSTLESVLEKSVEMGVSSLTPLVCDYSFIKNFSEKEWAHKSERWKKIIISATQQSGRGELLKIQNPIKLPDLLAQMNRTPRSLGLFLYEGDTKLDIKRHLRGLDRSQPIENIWLIIGSEGGFSTQEVDLCLKQGLSPVTLGEQILRVETACIAGISVLKYEFDLMGGN